MRILAIETSCDETAIAIIDFNKKTRQVKVLANLVSSQVEIHKPFGGVVPNLARREHQRNLAPILLRALENAKLLNLKIKNQKLKLQFKNKNLLQTTRHKLQTILEREPELLEHFKKEILPLKTPNIDAVAITYGPGLAPALWVGINFAKALSYIWKKPLVPVNHMTGHVFSALLKKYGSHKSQTPNFKQIPNSKFQILNPRFPALALLVSGGHTELVLIKKPWKYKTVGETLDDAAGECFDKVARILDLPYPGGPEISRIAERANNLRVYETLNSKGFVNPKIELPRPMLYSKDFNFSFSGLKTAVLYLVRDLERAQHENRGPILGSPASEKPETSISGRLDFRGHPISAKIKAAIARKFQDAVVEVLVTKTMRAAEKYKAKTIILGGGVAANKELRRQLGKTIKKEIPNSKFYIPDYNHTGDNALMIALAAAITGKMKIPNKIGAESNLGL